MKMRVWPCKHADTARLEEAWYAQARKQVQADRQTLFFMLSWLSSGVCARACLPVLDGLCASRDGLCRQKAGALFRWLVVIFVDRLGLACGVYCRNAEQRATRKAYLYNGRALLLITGGVAARQFSELRVLGTTGTVRVRFGTTVVAVNCCCCSRFTVPYICMYVAPISYLFGCENAHGDDTAGSNLQQNK